jgi:hypothetical protein
LELDGFIKLNDAQLRASQVRADVAGKMADVATKVAQLGVIREEIIKKRLENIAKALDIKWDTQAHAHLLRMRNQSLQEARRIDREAEKVRSFSDRLGRLLAGDGSWTALRDAWLAFEFFRGRVPTSAAVKMGSVPVEPAAYTAASWRHPERKQIGDVPADERDLGGLWGWARRQTLYPRTGSPAWNALAAYLGVMSEAAAAQADKLQGEADAAEKDAIELATLDWDRLKDKN